MQQRYYDPVVGRFISGDPMASDMNTGWNFNRYNYANNNPYKFTDPDGRQACMICRSPVAYANKGMERPEAQQALKDAARDMAVTAVVVGGAPLVAATAEVSAPALATVGRAYGTALLETDAAVSGIAAGARQGAGVAVEVGKAGATAAVETVKAAYASAVTSTAGRTATALAPSVGEAIEAYSTVAPPSSPMSPVGVITTSASLIADEQRRNVQLRDKGK